MYKRIILIIFIFLASLNIFSQSDKNIKKSILIYSDGQGYLQSFIEKSIKNLINVDSESKYFSSVTSFNRIYSDNKYKAQLNDLIRTQKDNSKPTNLHYSTEENVKRNEIYALLKGYKYFLTVNTNTLGELIEFQFELFETIPSEESIPYNILNKVIGSENFFINPKDEKCYSIIEQSLQRLFKQSNRIPEAELNIFGRIFKDNELEYEINIPQNTLITIDGSNSGDFDNDNITYLWRNITQKNEKYQTSKKLLFKQNEAKQEILISDAGLYKIGFKVFDGVSYSNEIILNINSKQLQKSTLLDSIKYSINYQNINFKSNKKSEAHIFIYEKLNSNDSVNRKIIVTTSPVHEKYINYIDKSIIYDAYELDYYNKQNSSNFFLQINLKSNFDNSEKKSDQKTYYVHDVDDEGLAYNEREIKHKLINRQPFSFGLRYENSAIQNNKSQFIVNSLSFLINVFFINRLELELSIPYPNSKTIPVENAIVEYPGFFNLSARYFLININKTNNLINLKPYATLGIKSFNNRSPVNYVGASTGSVFCYFGGLGIEKQIKTYDTFDFSLRISFQRGFFTNKYLKNYEFSSLGIDTVFRF